MATCLAMYLMMHFVGITMHFAMYLVRYLNMRIVSYITMCMPMHMVR